MKRREFIAGLGGAAAWPVAARAQQGEPVRRVGVMMGSREDNEESRAWLKAFLGGLKDAGWEQPRNIEVYPRWPAGDPVRMRLLAKEIVALQPDVIVAGTTPAVKALLEETKSLPIVFTNVTDPVGTGLVASLARPGGTTSGFSAFEYSLGGIWVQLLKTVAPQIAHVAIMFNPDTAPDDRQYFPSIESAKQGLALAASEALVRTAADIEIAIAAQGGQTRGGLVVIPDTFAASNSKLIIEIAARHRVPAIYHHRFMAVEGGLISYGTSAVDLYRRAASYVDRILRGAKVSELPVQQPTKFELVINLKTAKSLGLTIPETLLATADEVIQ
jgi:putative tryptophan/tyrosine transport system substrate-binding protein